MQLAPAYATPSWQPAGTLERLRPGTSTGPNGPTHGWTLERTAQLETSNDREHWSDDLETVLAAARDESQGDAPAVAVVRDDYDGGYYVETLRERSASTSGVLQLTPLHLTDGTRFGDLVSESIVAIVDGARQIG